MKERTLDGFGAHVTALRQAQCLTQDELGALVGISNRTIAYDERDGAPGGDPCRARKSAPRLDRRALGR